MAAAARPAQRAAELDRTAAFLVANAGMRTAMTPSDATRNSDAVIGSKAEQGPISASAASRRTHGAGNPQGEDDGLPVKVVAHSRDGSHWFGCRDSWLRD